MAIRILGCLVLLALLGALVLAQLRQCRRPRGRTGRRILEAMNRHHAPLTAWGLGHLEIGRSFAVLDVGCGGGRTIATLAALASEGTICGVDYSEASVAASTGFNADLVQAGRVEIRQASVSSLPYPEGRFDLVTAVETHYYWPRPVEDLREIRRVLKPGGRLVLVVEAYRGSPAGSHSVGVLRLIGGVCWTPGEHREMLAAAGFSDVEVEEETSRGWLRATGRKPALAAT